MWTKRSILPGDVFGVLTVYGETVAKQYPGGQRARQFNCTCICGAPHTADITVIGRGGLTRCIHKKHKKERINHRRIIRHNGQLTEISFLRKKVAPEMHRDTFTSRILRGWSVDKSAATPERVRHTISYNGQQMKLSEIYKQLTPEITFESFYHRVVKRGWSIEDAANKPAMPNGKNNVV